MNDRQEMNDWQDRVAAEARKSALVYDYVNDACPYPFTSEAGEVFKEHFMNTRRAIAARYEGEKPQSN